VKCIDHGTGERKKKKKKNMQKYKKERNKRLQRYLGYKKIVVFTIIP